MDRDRVDQQLRLVREHLMASCEEAIAEAQRDVDEAAARGDEHGRQYWERCVADHTAMLRRWQAEERVA